MHRSAPFAGLLSHASFALLLQPKMAMNKQPELGRSNANVGSIQIWESLAMLHFLSQWSSTCVLGIAHAVQDSSTSQHSTGTMVLFRW